MTLAEKTQLSTDKTLPIFIKRDMFNKCYDELAVVIPQRVKIILFCLTLVIPNSAAIGQTISGNLSFLTNQVIKLEGFNGLHTYPIAQAIIDEEGNFLLNYSQSNYGAGYLVSVDEKPFFVILRGEDIDLVGKSLSYTETIKIVQGRENHWFEQYAKEHPRREQALNVWNYLEKIYTSDSLFSEQHTPQQVIQNEIKRIKDTDAAFLSKLPKDSYVSWFLPVRKLVSSVSNIAMHRPEEIPETITAFRSMDYSDQRLYRSGLFKDAIDSHFWLLENSGLSLDSMFIEMQLSIDTMMIDLVKDEKILNELTDYLFKLFERHSLFQASEYLSLKVLNEVSCTIESDLARQLETYRVMKKGNIAPDIIFKGETLAPGYNPSNLPTKLSDIKSKYTVVIFGANWCPKCSEDLPSISKLYEKWKIQGVEVLFVSLDEDSETYRGFVKDSPFISTCDFKKWESPMVTDYYVFATPTIYLLDSTRKILLKPNSVKHLDAWVDWYLVQGNN